MVELLEEVFQARARRTILHNYRAIYFKLLLVVLVVASRFISIHLVPLLLLVDTLILLYIGVRRILLATFTTWVFLALLITSINLLLGSFKQEYFYNLVYGFTTFTATLLFFATTTPRDLRRLIGFNTLTLSYLFLDYSYKLVVDTIQSLQARGWRAGPSSTKYLLRAFGVLLVTRLKEVEEALRARGLE